MAERKPLPPTGKDNRRVYPVDALRAKFWYSSVKQIGNFSSNYALAKTFGGDPKKWASYANGSQPNELVLDQVDAEFCGTKLIYTSGPMQLKLWPALQSEEMEILSLIAKKSERIDGLIAKFRSDAMNNNLTVMWDKDPGDQTFEPHIQKIEFELEAYFEFDVIKEITQILREWMRPYEAIALRRYNENFIDYIMDSRFSNAYMRDMREQEEYESIQSSTVKQKGRRKNDEI